MSTLTKLGLMIFLAALGFVGIYWLVSKITAYLDKRQIAPTGQPTPAERQVKVETDAAVLDLSAKRAKAAQEVKDETLEQVVDGLNGGGGHSGDD